VSSNWQKWLQISMIANLLIGLAILMFMYVDSQEAGSDIGFWFDYYIYHPATTFPIATFMMFFFSMVAIVMVMFGFGFLFEGSFLKSMSSFLSSVPSIYILKDQVALHLLMFYDTFIAGG